jgi:molybdopterin-guanine dinucleotide biosynthesis protein A
LAERLATEIRDQQADICVAHDGERMQPVFALLRRELLPSLLNYLEDGGRKIDTWYAQHKVALADFSDCPDMFFNVNTPREQAEAHDRMRSRRS